MFHKTYSTRHYFNNILFTPWPFFIGICLFQIIFMFILILNKYYLFNPTVTYSLFLFAWYILLEMMIQWIMEIVEESFFGKYTKKLRAALICGFFLFLISEIMVFGSFFWAFFDRMFHTTYATGFLSIPTSIESIRWFKEPLYATLILITSGYTGNYSCYLYKSRNIFLAYIFSILTNLLGLFFLYIQYSEYNHLEFSISDNVYCSIFFLLTGFHGFHVIVGNLFLFIQYLLKFHYIDNKVFGLTLALIYWHFVDFIWIFLFVFVYVFNNIDYLLLKGENIVLHNTSFLYYFYQK